jgi:hypothetical protein
MVPEGPYVAVRPDVTGSRVTAIVPVTGGGPPLAVSARRRDTEDHL